MRSPEPAWNRCCSPSRMRDVDRLALGGDLARVDAHDDLRVAGTGVHRVGVAELVGQRAVDERVGAELLDDVHDDRDAVRRAGGHDVERLGTEADRDVVLVVVGELADDRRAGRRRGRGQAGDAVEHRERADVHGRRADEAGDEHVGRGVVHVARRADLLQEAVLEDRDAVTHGQGLGLVVRDVDGGDAEATLQRRDLRTGLDAELGVEVRQRLVHEEHLGLTHDGAAHGDALTLATGEGLRLAVEVLRSRSRILAASSTRWRISAFGVPAILSAKPMLSATVMCGYSA